MTDVIFSLYWKTGIKLAPCVDFQVITQTTLFKQNFRIQLKNIYDTDTCM